MISKFWSRNKVKTSQWPPSEWSPWRTPCDSKTRRLIRRRVFYAEWQRAQLRPRRNSCKLRWRLGNLHKLRSRILKQKLKKSRMRSMCWKRWSNLQALPWKPRILTFKGWPKETNAWRKWWKLTNSMTRVAAETLVKTLSKKEMRFLRILKISAFHH